MLQYDMNSLLIFPEELSGEHEATLRGDRRRYAVESHELVVGTRTRLALFGGKRGHGIVTSITGDDLRLDVDLTLDPLPVLTVIPLVAVCRPQTVKKVLWSAAMFGVPELHFFGGNRSQKSYFQSKALSQSEIDRQIALGLEQVWNSQGPKVLVHRHVQDAVVASGADSILLADESGAPIMSYADELTSKPLRVIFGPELGWSEHERSVLAAAGAVTVRVTDRSLRLEVAFDAILGTVAAMKL